MAESGFFLAYLATHGIPLVKFDWVLLGESGRRLPPLIGTPQSYS